MRILFKTSYNDDINLFRHDHHGFWYALLFVILLALPFLISDYMVGEFTNVLIWALAGMGLMILVGQTGQASLGHAAFLAIGCYANVILQTRFGLPFLISFPLAGLITGLAGVLLAIPTTRLHGIYLAIATLAASIIMEDIIVLAEPITGGVSGLYAPDITLFSHTINRYAEPSVFYWLTLTVVLIIVLFYKNLLRSPLGRAFAANVSQDLRELDSQKKQKFLTGNWIGAMSHPAWRKIAFAAEPGS